MSNIILKSNNTNIKFMSSATEAASVAYKKAYKQNPENNALDGYLFFDLYSACIFLNGKQISNSISKLNKDGEIIGYKFSYNGDEIIVYYSSIGTWDGNGNGLVISANDVQAGLMSKSDKVSLKYLEDQIGFYVKENKSTKENGETTTDSFEIVKTTPKYMQWHDLQ